MARAVLVLVARGLSYTRDCPTKGRIPLANVLSRQSQEALLPRWCQRPVFKPCGETVDIERPASHHPRPQRRARWCP
jgi:hypothetical protein